jgi:hypothetical protein
MWGARPPKPQVASQADTSKRARNSSPFKNATVRFRVRPKGCLNASSRSKDPLYPAAFPLDALSQLRDKTFRPQRLRELMGGPGAPDDISKAHLTQVWLATSDDPLALKSGAYFYHQTLREPNPVTRDERVQDQLIEACARLSGISLAA